MSKIAKITEVDGTSSQDNNLTDIQKRTQNMLDNAKEQIKKAKDKVKNTRPSELAEVDYTNYEDFSSDEFRNKPFMPAPIVNSAGYGTFRGEPIRVENALNSPDNPNEEVPKWANIKEELPEMENHVEPKRPVPEVVDPGFNVPPSLLPPTDKRFPELVNPVEPVPKPSEPDNRKEEVPKDETHPVEGPEDETHPEELPEDETLPVEGPELANRKEEVKKAQDKGIIQIAVLAVAVAGTVAAYLWGKN